MKMILVPLDGSILAEQALPFVSTVARLLDARICLLRVVADSVESGLLANTIVATYGVGAPLAAQQARQAHSLELLSQNAERYLDSHAALLRADGLDVVVDVRYGRAADVIVDAALNQHVILIALASHGYSGLKRWALGSVADNVVRATSIPVLIVRGRAPTRTPVLSRIMVPLNGSPLAHQALPLATELARSAHAELLLVQAITPATTDYPGFATHDERRPQLGNTQTALRHQTTSTIDTLAAELRIHEVDVRTHLVNGHVAEVLVHEAAHCGVDLIVMATHGYGGLRRWALGSVADTVLHATTTPLILVRAAVGAVRLDLGTGGV
jgi:nucleotide-binding universal stress UspA family protein